jgi:NADPH2:quinone reductase
MKAVICSEYGPPSLLRVQDLPSPLPGPKQVLVSNRVAGVNFPDTLIIQGKYQFKPAPPFSPGGELAGVILKVGSEVSGLVPGDKVVALTTWGAFAQEVVADAANVIPLPHDLDEAALEKAGSFTMTYGTSLHALKDRAQARAGETLLVLGAAGGVGLAAVEIGKLLGLRVIAAASSPEKLAIARARGADECIDYSSENLRERLRSLTGSGGVDIVYDPVGGSFTEPALRSLSWRGRHLVIGFAAGAIPQVALNLVLLKGSAIVGVFWGDFMKREPQLNASNMTTLFEWLAQGRIEPLISARYPLSAASQALEDLQARRVTGKAVILPQQL